MNQPSSSSGFRIGPDDEEIDPYGRPDLPRPRRPRTGEDPRIAKIHRRLTLITLLLPLLFALMVALAYSLLEKRLNKAQSADTAEFQSLLTRMETLAAAGKRTEEGLAEAVLRQEAIEERLEEREAAVKAAVAALEKASKTLRQDLKAAEGKIAPVREQLQVVEATLRRIDAEKADAGRVAAAEKTLADLKRIDPAKLAERVEAVGASVAPLEGQIEAARKALAALEEAHARDQAAAGQAIEGARSEVAQLSADYKQLKKDLVDVLAVTIDQKGLSGAIQAQERTLRAEIQTLRRSLEAKDRALSRLQESLGSLERRVSALGKNRPPLGEPKPGTFIEQNIE